MPGTRSIASAVAIVAKERPAPLAALGRIRTKRIIADRRSRRIDLHFTPTESLVGITVVPVGTPLPDIS